MTIRRGLGRFIGNYTRTDVKAKDKRKLYEALFTISNGYLGMRGINEDMPSNTLPGTFIAGAFDKSECMCVEMVNFPNTIPLYFLIDGEKVDLDKSEILEHNRYLDSRHKGRYAR